MIYRREAQHSYEVSCQHFHVLNPTKFQLFGRIKESCNLMQKNIVCQIFPRFLSDWNKSRVNLNQVISSATNKVLIFFLLISYVES